MCRRVVQYYFCRHNIFNFRRHCPRPHGNGANFFSPTPSVSRFHAVADAAEVLPALPPAWPKGSVRGLRARGGFEVDIAWSDGRLTQAVIRSMGATTATVRCAGKTVVLATAPGGEYRLDGTLALSDDRH
jgi:hypothetical protein